MWLASPKHAHLVQHWLAYHRAIGFDRFVVYDLDGSLATAVAPFVADGFVIYIDRWPARLSPGVCTRLHLEAEVPGQKEKPWMRYCTQTQAEAHCVWSMRGRARWAMLLHSFDAYASSASGLRGGISPLLDRLEPLRSKAAVLQMLRFDFGGVPGDRAAAGAAAEHEESAPPTVRFLWRQHRPLLLRGAQQGALDLARGAVDDHPGAVLANPLNTWPVFTHWARGRPGTVCLTLPPELLRLNHYVDVLGRPRCAQAAADSGHPPCDVFDNSSSWTRDLTASGRAAAAVAAAKVSAQARQAPPLEEEGSTPRLLVVVPGHGKASRSATLRASLRHLHSEPWSAGAKPSCLVFIYNMSPDFLALPDTRALSSEHGCALQPRPGDVFFQFLRDTALSRTLRRIQPHFVLLLLDDIALGTAGRPVHALELAGIARRNRLDVVAPALVGTHLSYDGMRPTSLRRPKAVGRLVTFLEWEVALFTPQAFSVLRRMVKPELSRTWGYDELFPGAFRARAGHAPRMGLVDGMHATHTGPWLASTTMVEEQVYAEEQAILTHYLHRFNITPAPIRMRQGYIF